MRISTAYLFPVLLSTSSISVEAFATSAASFLSNVRQEYSSHGQILFKAKSPLEGLTITLPLIPLSLSSKTDLPDYGKTSVEVDQHTIDIKKNEWRRPELFGKSLIDQTKKEMLNNSEFQETVEKLNQIGPKGMSKEERTKRRRALDELGVPPFNQFLAEKTDAGVKDLILTRKSSEVLQLNVGLYCNQACGHCHVESSPLRKETMSSEVAAQCMTLLKNTPSITTLDITGGAPEMQEQFRYIVAMARGLRPDLDIIDRCNLTVLQEPGQEDLLEFLARHKVHVIASMPCYSADNVDKQRGNGVFDRSISALLALNEAGFGKPDSGLYLDLVYNPLGAFLPPPQKDLEIKYKEVLNEKFGILFNSLFTMTNMPVKRFTDFLYKRNELKDYMDLLVRNFNTGTLDNLMCGNTISVGFDGKVFDCDFNQQLGYGIGTDEVHEGGKSVFDISSLDELKSDPIKNDSHCFGCTAGMGSS
jgi:radical SAM/Cys-rich protein